MFLTENYVLGNELVQKMDIHIANVSIAHSDLENIGNNTDIIKINNCTFLNNKSKMLPKNLQEGLQSHEFTSLHGLLPLSYILKDFGITKKTVESLIKEGPYFKEIVEIAGKKFVRFSDAFIQLLDNTVHYVLNEKETKECETNGDIDGYIKLDNTKYLTWYYLEPTGSKKPHGCF